MLGPREEGRQSKDDANGKEKFRVVISASERPRIPDALQHRQDELVVIDIIMAAHRDAEVDRLERGRVGAPAAVGFLERERLLDPQFARNRKALSNYP